MLTDSKEVNFEGNLREIMITIDTHGLRYIEATLEICGRIEEAYSQGHDEIKIIHGFNRGTSIRNYVRSDMVQDLKKYSKTVPKVNLDCLDPGITMVKFENT